MQTDKRIYTTVPMPRPADSFRLRSFASVEDAMQFVSTEQAAGRVVSWGHYQSRVDSVTPGTKPGALHLEMTPAEDSPGAPRSLQASLSSAAGNLWSAPAAWQPIPLAERRWLSEQRRATMAARADSQTPDATWCWVGGYLWGDGADDRVDMLPEFRKASAWWHGFRRDDPSPEAQGAWSAFDQIAIGDRFAVKGWGGRNDLKVHLVGIVRAKDEEAGRVELDISDSLPSPQSIKPAAGTGSWSVTLREVTDPAIIRWMFDGEPYVPSARTGTGRNASKSTHMPDESLNLILYGPPGTGKTYATIERAVRIIDGTDAPFANRATMKGRYDDLVREGRIGFVTFHQSYSYEDFVEGIRPVTDEAGGNTVPRYECKAGVLKEIATRALAGMLSELDSAPDEPRSIPFLSIWNALLNRLRGNPMLDALSPGSQYMVRATSPGGLNAVNKAKPNGAFYVTSRGAMEKVWSVYAGRDQITTTEAASLFDGKHGHHFFKAAVFRELARIASDLKEQVTPLPEDAPSEAVQSYLAAGQTGEYRFIEPPADRPRYVLIIDEINRGNISKILGELITLLEDDKRLPGENTITVTLPYSREMFALPANLYILGTMNTADKSIAMVDVALRRRFDFEELTPDFSPIVCPHLTPAMRDVLEELNRRITMRKDRDHRIGHAFFVRVGDEAGFNRVFKRKVAPLLQEYFYGDWEGLRYVLGESGSDGKFVRRLSGAGNGYEARNAWQWYTDVDDNTLSALRTLAENYGIDG